MRPDLCVLLRLIQPMLESVEETIAVCGGVPAPPAPGLAARFGALESLRSWLTLGADQRAALELREVQGLSFADVLRAARGALKNTNVLDLGSYFDNLQNPRATKKPPGNPAIDQDDLGAIDQKLGYFGLRCCLRGKNDRFLANGG